ncbi:MAG: peptidase S1, partial [Candidatus Nitrosocosmicus sp.]
YLKVFCANGYYDAVTPFFQTQMDLKNMPIGDKKSLNNLEFHNYESGHMIYLDNLKNSRSNMKKDLAAFYDNTLAHHAALAAAKIASSAEGRTRPSRYRRRFNRTPY